MPKYRVTPPTTEGRFRAVYNAVANSTTDWIDIDSSDFTSMATGVNLDSGLTLVSITAVSLSGNIFYLKYRPRDSANDSILASDGVLPVFTSWFDNPTNLYEGPVTTFSFKKTQSTDEVFFIAGFEL